MTKDTTKTEKNPNPVDAKPIRFRKSAPQSPAIERSSLDAEFCGLVKEVITNENQEARAKAMLEMLALILSQPSRYKIWAMLPSGMVEAMVITYGAPKAKSVLRQWKEYLKPNK